MARLHCSPYRFAATAAFAVALASLAPRAALTQGVESEMGETSPDESSGVQTPEPVWLGVHVPDDSEDRPGAAISRIIDGSPAARAGLERNDRILTVDGTKVDNLSSLQEALSDFQPGDRVELQVRRGDDEKSMTVTLSARPSESDVMRRQLVGSRLSNLELRDLAGDAVETADLRGKPLVIEFWATWCYPCRAVQKTLGEVDETFGDRIEILAVSSEKRDVLRKYRRKVDLPYRIVRDADETVHERLMVARYPTVVIVDPEGTIAEVFVGVDHGKSLTSTLEKMLED